MERSPISRRNFLSLTAATGAGAALAACGSSGPGGDSSGGGKAGTASYWFLTGQPGEGIRQTAAERFNKANPNNKIEFTAFGSLWSATACLLCQPEDRASRFRRGHRPRAQTRS